jgi:hypothetical protein
MSAQAQRIRAHLAGAKGHDTTVCPGPPPKVTSETQEAYNARRVAFEAARARMKKLMADAASATAEASRKRELDRSTSSAHDKVQAPLFRPRNASAAQQAADEAVALAFVSAGWAPNAIENPFVVEALKKACARAALLAPSAPGCARTRARCELRACCGAAARRFSSKRRARRPWQAFDKTRLPALRRSPLSAPRTSFPCASRSAARCWTPST